MLNVKNVLNFVSFFFSEVDCRILLQGLSFSCYPSIFLLLESISPVQFLFLGQEGPKAW